MTSLISIIYFEKMKRMRNTYVKTIKKLKFYPFSSNRNLSNLTLTRIICHTCYLTCKLNRNLPLNKSNFYYHASKHVIMLIKVSLLSKECINITTSLYSKFLHNIEWHIIVSFIHERIASEMAERKQEIFASVHCEY